MHFCFRRTIASVLFVACAVALAWCGRSPTAPSSTTQLSVLSGPSGTGTEGPDGGSAPATPPTTPAAPETVAPGTGSVWVNVIGDTGWCGSEAMSQVARLLSNLSGDILLAGDLAYMNGTLEEFRRCFDPDFGQFGDRLRPTPGNHDYGRPDADGYFTYFGARAGPARRGYYSFRAASWKVLMLNSSVPINRNSEQYSWVREELEQSPTRCTLAVVHHPFESSGKNGPNPWLREIWQLLHEHGVEVVAAAHDHLYERFAPQDANPRPDPSGVRQFTAGTGGAPLYSRRRSAPNSEVVIVSHGVLRLKLDPTLYEWEFLDVNGNALDRGMTACH
jgi:hypothetical protein